ncbi:putative UDP-glucuronosyl/UDP-glucosyltransferase, UDP-glycosyltransferase family [Dioscorea sansibarensis]
MTSNEVRKSSVNGASTPKPHFVLVPLMAQGHMIPMVELAQLIAGRGGGVLVTVITTPLNSMRLKTTMDRFDRSGLAIRLVSLPFPWKEAGLPEGCENIDVLPSAALAVDFFKATSLLRQPLETYLREHKHYPSCIISDSCHPWTWDVARSLQIPRFTFFGICCFTLLCTHNIASHNVFDTITSEREPFLVPGLQDRIEVTQAQAPGFFPGDLWAKLREEIRVADEGAEGVVVNSFRELEPWYVENYQKAMGNKVWTLGPFSLCNKDASHMTARGNDAAIDENSCMKWLDSMKPRTVVYVSFGSLTFTSPSQLMEVGMGLEASQQPFIWVIKEVELCREMTEWLGEGGFEERVKSKGLVIRGWAPQMMILSHPAIGGFVTHCGWNSLTEAISMGLPVITWPHFADQFLNERYIVDVLRTGVPVGVDVPATWGQLETSHVYVTKDGVERAVRSLMDGGDEGAQRRERARQVSVTAEKAMEPGGSSYENITMFMQQFSQQPAAV